MFSSVIKVKVKKITKNRINLIVVVGAVVVASAAVAI